MGWLEDRKRHAAERREARELAAREEQEAANRRREDEDRIAQAVQLERELAPADRIAQPAWTEALTNSGIEPGMILAVVDGRNGAIHTPASSGTPNRRSVRVGAVVLTADRLAYAFRGESGVEVVTRNASEVDEMRKAGMDGSVWVVFENDRSFPQRGGQIHRADNWEIWVEDHNPDSIRTTFLQAGYDV